MENQPPQPTETPVEQEQSIPLDDRLQNAPDSSPDLMFDPEARQAQSDHATYMDTRPATDASTDQYNLHFDEKRDEHLDGTTKDYQDMTFYELRKKIGDAQEQSDVSTVNEVYRMMPDKQLAKLAAFSKNEEDKATQDRVYEEVFDRIKIMGEEASIDEEQAVGYFNGIIDKAERSMNGEKIREPENQDGANVGDADIDPGAEAGQDPSSEQQQFAKEVGDYHEDLLSQNALYIEHLGIMKNYHDSLPADHDNKANPHTDPDKYRSMLREAAQNNVFNRWVDKSYKDKLDTDETLRNLSTPDQQSMQKQAIRKKELLDESRNEVYKTLTARDRATDTSEDEENGSPDEDITRVNPIPPTPPEAVINRQVANEAASPARKNSKREAAKAKMKIMARKSPIKIRKKTRPANKPSRR